MNTVNNVPNGISEKSLSPSMTLPKRDDNIFWFDDPTVLYRNGNYKNIKIKKNMTQAEFFNVITRCTIILALILLVILAIPGILMLLLIALLMIVIIYYLMLYSEIETFDVPSLSNTLLCKDNRFNVMQDGLGNLTRDNYTMPTTNNLVTNLYNKDSEYDNGTNYGSNYGTNSYYSYPGGNTINSFYGSPTPTQQIRSRPQEGMTNDKYNSLIDIGVINNFSDLQDNINNCGVNAANESYDKINNGYNNQELKQFRSDLFETVDNVFEKKNFERQFNTVQNRTNPTNESNARKWIYATPITCKETSAQCLEYEDLSRKRSPII